MKKGAAIKVLTAAGTYKTNIGKFDTVLLHHKITGGVTGGFASLKMSNATDGTFIAHHGKGANIKSAATTASYTSIFEGVMDWVEITLTATDGTHEVTIQPIEL